MALGAVGFVGRDGVQNVGVGGGEECMEPVGIEQGFRSGGILGIQLRNPAHDQTARDTLGFLLRLERREHHFGNLGIGVPFAGFFIEDGVGLFHFRPRVLADARDSLFHVWVHAHRQRNFRLGPSRGRGRGAQTCNCGQQIGTKFAGIPCGNRSALAEPGPGSDRSCFLDCDGLDQRVQTLDTGISATGALFLVSAGRLDRVINIDQREFINPRSDRGYCGQCGQPPCCDGIELADMPERECAQERSQRRRGIRCGEQFAHPAVT